jgi:hypothetical protein
MDQATQTLSERLGRMERENSRIKRSARLIKIAMASTVALCVATYSVPWATGAPTLKVLSTQQLNIVNASGRVLASLGLTSDGNVLTFYDSSGKKTLTFGNNANETLAGAVAWDNNNVVPGTGRIRVTWGESNPNVGPVSGFGAGVFDGAGRARTAFGTSYDLTNNSIAAFDPNGTSAGIGIFPSQFVGYYASDTNGVTRQFGGLAFDSAISDYLNEIALEDSTGVTRVSAAQVPPTFSDAQHRAGNAFVIWDPNGLQQASMSAFTDGSLAGFNVVDTNNLDRFSAYLFQNSMNVVTRNANGVVTGHLP